MKSVLLISLLLATIALPLVLARRPRPRAALLQLALGMAGFVVVYLLALRYLYPRLP